MKTEELFISGDRYLFDFRLCSNKKGFAQVDTSQDASYYGTWANPFDLVIVTYVEGDLKTQTANSPEEFRAEIYRIKEFTEKFGYEFLGIDPGFNGDLKQKFIDLGLENLLH
jgi:hypothetical protein